MERSTRTISQIIWGRTGIRWASLLITSRCETRGNLSNLIRNDLALSTPLGLSPSSVFRAPHAPATKARRVSCFIDLGPINLGFISGICYSEAKMLFPIHGFACQRIDFASLFWWPMIYYFEDQYHSNILSTFPKIAKVVPDHCSQLFLKICAGTVNFG